MTSDTAITCKSITKSFGATVALRDFTLTVETGTMVGLLGPSGSGKTTALRVIAGFEVPDAGSVTIGDMVVVGPGEWVPPERRRVGMVFQDYALFPHMDVAANVAYGLGSGDSTKRVQETLELVGLGGFGSRMPHELSGGEQQRVALARALAPRPAVILLDEPFSNLDTPQRERVRREVRAILVEARTTAVFVTHDQEEALSMSDVVAVMRDGHVLQTAPPHEAYRQPVDCWVARFLGEGKLVPGVATGATVDTSLGRLTLAAEADGEVEVLIRPDAVSLRRDSEGDATVVASEFYGHDQLVSIMLSDGRTLLSRHGASPVLVPGDRVTISVSEVVAFPAHDHQPV